MPDGVVNFCPDHSPVVVAQARLLALESLADVLVRRRRDGWALPDAVHAALDRLEAV